ncbi:hypothetical protein ABBQ32_004219 [Trebouxia sp. C0010 RCD-2024]
MTLQVGAMTNGHLASEVLEALWGTNELLSSFDSINIMKPGQRPGQSGGCTLVVKRGSHSSHEDCFENATVLSEEEKQQTEDFYMFQDQERAYFHKFDNRASASWRPDDALPEIRMGAVVIEQYRRQLQAH